MAIQKIMLMQMKKIDIQGREDAGKG